mgnify:CR=1 FL=1
MLKQCETRCSRRAGTTVKADHLSGLGSFVDTCRDPFCLRSASLKGVPCWKQVAKEANEERWKHSGLKAGLEPLHGEAVGYIYRDAI